MAAHKAGRQEFVMVGSLAVFLPAGAAWMLAIGSTWAAVLLFIGGELIAFRAGYVLVGVINTADRRSRFFRVVRLLVHRDDRPPLSPTDE